MPTAKASALMPQPNPKTSYLLLLLESSQEALHTSREVLQVEGTGLHGKTPDEVNPHIQPLVLVFKC